MKISAFTVEDVPMIQKGDDLAKIVADRACLENDDIVVFASTIVSKAEGRRFLLDAIEPTAEARELALLNKEDPKFIQYVLDNSTRVLLKHPLLVQTIYGNVCINAGIDRSNTESGYILLLPEDSDRSAREIRDRLKELTGKTVAVVITDTNGRSFREGQIGVAVGCAGIAAVHDRRGDVDLFGHELKITIQGITDEVASCANMIMGEANEGTPIAIIRGYRYVKDDRGIKVCYRSDETDLVKQALYEKLDREASSVHRENSKKIKSEG
ncbi:coenzyme F420-0:L-glutamate ligase [Methanocella arvoryzae]|uniref:Coenzyme F420-0:gamma-glutamyl ligase n=1 Tax=Methanocella arvoryzae (strain DSM 22066 / NBRC 105507 / MRE50) TaxID=351160 RepID=Q0W0K1_METAR|nr:coenzyme F420-0:L-glutamate ligase [Methanocella arvoryzae]CAJ38092.1 putative coenzyme F420-0:gamma-glutamyl ligase [Methanocella arvoryzae MRE50]